MMISKIERGITKMENVPLKNAIALADALGVENHRQLLLEADQVRTSAGESGVTAWRGARLSPAGVRTWRLILLALYYL